MYAELRQQLIDSFRWIDPGPASSHLISDLSGWWRDPHILAGIGPALAQLVADQRPTVVITPEVTGLLLGPLVATALGTGFVPAHKHGTDRTIPEPMTWATAGTDYRGRALTLGLRDRHLQPGDRVLLVDDWIVTGAQLRALAEIVAARRAYLVGAVAAVADCPPEVTAELRVRSLLRGDDLSH